MGRPLRTAAGGLAYHVLNRANARMRIFDKEKDYEAFERILDEAVGRVKMRLLAYCVMPNHWHLVVWPREDGDLSTFVGWLTLTHTQRWHAHRHSVGVGARVSRAIQVVPGGVGRAPVDGLPVRGAECVACRAVRPRRAVALVERLAARAWRRGVPRRVVRVADGHAAGLAAARQPRGGPARVGGLASLRRTEVNLLGARRGWIP